MKLGIGSYCYMWAHGVAGHSPATPLTAMQLLDRAAALGVRVAQLGPNLTLREKEIPELAARARDADIELELGIAGLDLDAIRSGAERCVALGGTLLRTVDLYTGPARPASDLERLLRAALPVLDACGVRLALENALTPAAVISAVLDCIGSPRCGVTLDTVNSLAIPEGTEQVVDALARHTLCLHVKDFRVKRIWHMMGFTVEGTPAGAGQLDVPRLLARLAGAGRDPNAILELWVPQQRSPEETVALEDAWVKTSIAYLRQFIAA